MNTNEPSKQYMHEYSSLESVLKGIRALDDTELVALIKEQSGIDLNQPKRHYTQEAMQRIVEIILQARFPELSKREAMVKLGRATSRGYAKTLIGQVMVAPLKGISPERALRLLIRMLGSNVNFGERELVKINDHEYIIQFRDDPRTSAFMEGIVLQFLEDLSIGQASIQIRSISKFAFDIRISW